MTKVALFVGDHVDRSAIAGSLPDLDLDFRPEWRDWSEAQLADYCRSVDAVVTSRSSPRLPDSLIGSRGRLKLLAHCHGSVRSYVTKRHIEDGLLVSNWGDAVSGVAEGAVCLILACLKQLANLDRFIRSGWNHATDPRIWLDFPASLNGRDVGLYGYGPIGRHCARMLEPFGAKVAIYDPYARDVPAHVRVCASLEELFRSSQIISIHCGLNDQTKGSVDARMLALLPQGGVVVNTARGAIVVEADLAAAVKERRIIAGVDVISDERGGGWERSPLSATDCYLTGHIITNGKQRSKTEGKMLASLPPFVVQNLSALHSGQPLKNLITAEEYDLKT